MNRKRRGELSELAFFYKATSLGFNLSKPWGDSSRYDFVVEHNGLLSKVQVKSTSQLWIPGTRSRATAPPGVLPTGGYYLNCQRRMKGGTFPYTPDEVDFFAAHIVPLDIWYVLPLSAVGSKYYLLFYPHLPARDLRLAPYREAWHLLEGVPKPDHGGSPDPTVDADHPITRSSDDPIASEPLPFFSLSIEACVKDENPFDL